MLLLTLFFFLCISEYTILLVNGEQEVIIPTELIKDKIRPGIKAYVMYLFVGTPPEPMTIEITFKHNLMIFYRDQSLRSVSYYEGDGGSEIVYFESKRFRVPIRYDPGRSLYEEHSHCISCDGMIGLGKGSFFWSLWPDASFTSSTIIAGGVNFLMKTSTMTGCKGCIIKCNDPLGTDKSLCITQGVLSNYKDKTTTETTIEIEKNTYPIRFSIDNPMVYLPQILYDRYMEGKNIYKDSVSDWEPLKISIPSVSKHIESNSKSHIIGKGIDLSKCHQKDIEIIIDPKYFFNTFEI